MPAKSKALELVTPRAQATSQMLARCFAALYAGFVLARPRCDAGMMAAMRFGREYLQILGTIVERVAIDVMHVFARPEFSTECSFNDDAMFVRPFAGTGDLDPSIDTATGIMQARRAQWLLPQFASFREHRLSKRMQSGVGLSALVAGDSACIPFETARSVIHERSRLAAATSASSELVGI